MERVVFALSNLDMSAKPGYHCLQATLEKDRQGDPVPSKNRTSCVQEWGLKEYCISTGESNTRPGYNGEADVIRSHFILGGYWSHSDYLWAVLAGKLGVLVAQSWEEYLLAYSMFGARGPHFEGGDWYKLEEHIRESHGRWALGDGNFCTVITHRIWQ